MEILWYRYCHWLAKGHDERIFDGPDGERSGLYIVVVRGAQLHCDAAVEDK